MMTKWNFASFLIMYPTLDLTVARLGLQTVTFVQNEKEVDPQPRIRFLVLKIPLQPVPARPATHAAHPVQAAAGLLQFCCWRVA